MAFNVGDRVVYKEEDINGKHLLGEIIDIWKNNKEMITGYFAALDSGVFVHIQPDNLNWDKLENILGES